MIAASNHILGSAWYLYEVYVDLDIKIHINLQRKLLRVTCYHGASSMTTHEKHDKLNHIHLCLGLINIHSKCFHRTYTGYKCTCKNKHTLEFWSTTNCRWYAEQLMVNSRLRLFPPLLLSERQRQNALPQQIITYKYDKEVCTKKTLFICMRGLSISVWYDLGIQEKSHPHPWGIWWNGSHPILLVSPTWWSWNGQFGGTWRAT